MGKLWACVKQNWKAILTWLVMGQCIAFWLIPIILAEPSIQSAFVLDLSPTLVLLYTISIFSLVIAYGPILRFWIRYKNAFAQNRGGQESPNPLSAQFNKRITHPDIFQKYFTLQVPISDIPDETIETMISVWNNLGPNVLETKFIKDLEKFKEEKQSARLIEKLSIFLPQITPVTAKTIISTICKNINLFSKEIVGLISPSEQDKALFVMLDLINQKIEHHQIEPLLIQAIQGEW